MSDLKRKREELAAKLEAAKQKYAPTIHELAVKALKAVNELIECHEAAKADAKDECLFESDEFPLKSIVSHINIVAENAEEELQKSKKRNV